MKIGIEAQRIFRNNKHGMDYVVLKEILHLQKLDNRNEYYIFVKPGPDRCVSDTYNFHIIEVSCPSYPLWEQWALPRAAMSLGVDILHCTSNTAPIFTSIPLVLTLHDIIFLEPRDKNNKSLYQNMGWLYRRLVVPRILGNCRRIITVSNYEYENIITKLNIPRHRMRMIYNGYNEWFQPVNDTECAYGKYIRKSGFFFFLGNTDPKKNSERTLVAYAKYLKLSSVKRELLVADLGNEIIDDILRRNDIEYAREYIVSAGYVDNKDLVSVYNAAFAFLYTSLRESFGIPLLESMACGTPVITSNTSSMPEVAGVDSALIDPADSDSITDMMLRLENDEEYYSKIRDYGLQRVKMFSWNRTAESLLSLYSEVYNEFS